MSSTEIKLYDIFRNDLKHQQTEFKSILKEDFYKVDLRIEQMNSKLEGVRGEIKESKTDMIKWMFAFWVTIILMLLANFFLKK